jgi:CDP-diacylglycerol--glycerol-3-phosphate 3-phosphatidyltransferase
VAVKKAATQVYSYKSTRVRPFTTANVITLLRLAAFVGLIYTMIAQPANFPYISAGLVAFSGAASALDGYVAKRRNEVTLLGQLLDSFLNKATIVGSMILLLHVKVAPALVVILMSTRELYAGLVRSMAHERGSMLPNLPLTPLKTMMHYAGVVCLMLSIELGPEIKQTGLGLMLVSIAMGWTSALLYSRSLFRTMRRRAEL